ncbi:DUF1467 family protein [Novosphingopyxis sp.]|uniref:DUF1467 family protein n=1 Tax=Novosphingopyxis sp. TaxID=2709690 RepID=UPI003B5C07D3
MQLVSAIAIYVLFWALTLFAVLPFGLRTHDELGIDKVPGQADSAPGNASVWKILLRTTVVAGILFGLFYLNYRFGWIEAKDFNFFQGLTGQTSVPASSGS